MVAPREEDGQSHAPAKIAHPHRSYDRKHSGEIDMNEPIMNTQAQAQSYLEKAATYRKLGLNAQVQYELEQARRVDPYVVQEHRYKTLLEGATAEVIKVEALKTPLRVGAGMLFVNAAIGTFFLVLIFTMGGGADLAGGEIIAPIVNLIIGINLWQMKPQWQKYTVWWAGLGLVLFGAGALFSGDIFSLITQVGFSGSLILLLAGTPTKARTISAVATFLVLYLGMICLLFVLSLLGVI
jgi:hypothetical protein